MTQLTPKQILALVLALTVGQAMAAAPTVGLVMAKSEIRIDSSPVTGNATVLSGNTVESVGGTSELRLNGGSVLLDRNARVQVFENRAELQSGKIQVRGGSLATAAGGILVQAPAGSEAVLVRNPDALVVGSLRGPVQVRTQEGMLLASLNPGTAMAFNPEPGDQGGASASKNPSQKPQQNPSKPANGGKMSSRAKAGWILGVSSAVVVPTAVVATRDNTKPVSR